MAKEFSNDFYYHAYNRGVDKRAIFQDTLDFQRFYWSLYLFNDANYKNPGNDPYYNDVLLAGAEQLAQDRDQLVKIISFCLLPNHFHLLVKQVKDGGVSKFFQKLGIGYVKYFNRKYERTGHLFEMNFKAIATDSDTHLFHLPRYIHLNAIDYSPLPWREGHIDDWARAQRILEGYPWSSHDAYMGRPQQLPVVDEEEVRNLFKSPEDYMQYLEEWGSRDTAQKSDVF